MTRRRAPSSAISAADDDVNKPPGSLPILVEGGAHTVTQVTMTTVEETVEEVATSFTIEGDVETFNATAVRIQLSELYGVPVSWIIFDTTSGSIVVKMVIRRPDAGSGQS